jgi:hypothetical protein
MTYRLFLGLFLLLSSRLQAQSPGVDAIGGDGTVVIGYVNQGGFINFTGPNLQLSWNENRLLLGMLPSLRFKKDQDRNTQNAFFTPALGVGFTYSWRKLTLQLPLYYEPKTANSNGMWQLGFGMGMRLWGLKK